MSFRNSVLAIPVALGLATVSASAAPIALSPLNPAHAEQVAAFGSTCAVPYAPAQVAVSNLSFPAVAREMRVEGVAKVGITLLPSGRVSSAWLIKSSGNAQLDRAAVQSGFDSEFVAERSQCAPVGGDYSFNADFSLDR